MLRIIRGRLPSHPAWVMLAPCIEIQHCHSRRERTEIRSGLSMGLQQKLLAIEMLCVSCRKQMIHPVKKRRGWGTLYLKVTCDADVNEKCCRSSAAREEVDAIIAAVRVRSL